jgi:hypothetical protein
MTIVAWSFIRAVSRGPADRGRRVPLLNRVGEPPDDPN